MLAEFQFERLEAVFIVMLDNVKRNSMVKPTQKMPTNIYILTVLFQ